MLQLIAIAFLYLLLAPIIPPVYRDLTPSLMALTGASWSPQAFFKILRDSFLEKHSPILLPLSCSLLGTMLIAFCSDFRVATAETWRGWR